MPVLKFSLQSQFSRGHCVHLIKKTWRSALFKGCGIDGITMRKQPFKVCGVERMVKNVWCGLRVCGVSRTVRVCSVSRMVRVCGM